MRPSGRIVLPPSSLNGVSTNASILSGWCAERLQEGTAELFNDREDSEER